MVSSLTGVLIYDGECAFCSAAAVAIRRIDDVGVVSWSDAEAQRFLEAQFDDVPFSLVFIDGESNTVFVGRDAARELASRAGVPSLVRQLIDRRYQSMAETVQATVGRGRQPDDVRGVESLRATAEFDALTRVAVERPEELA